MLVSYITVRGHIDTLNLPRWFSLVRIWTPWLAPRHGKTQFAIQEDAIVSAFLGDGGRHLVLLPISGVANVTTVLRSSVDGRVILRVSAVYLGS